LKFRIYYVIKILNLFRYITMPVLEAVPGTPQSDSLDSGDTHDCGHNDGNDNHNHGNSQSVLGNQEDHMKYERYRLDSFMSWPLHQNVDKNDLARHGFYYIGDGTDDRVQCAFCKIILKKWENGDVVEVEHKNFAPRCPFVCDPAYLGNYPGAYRQLPSNNVHHRGPLHREYSDRELRLKSFYNWPQNQRPTPGELANAGFFYLGKYEFSIMMLTNIVFLSVEATSYLVKESLVQ
jgi:hypothetical protein